MYVFASTTSPAPETGGETNSSWSRKRESWARPMVLMKCVRGRVPVAEAKVPREMRKASGSL